MRDVMVDLETLGQVAGCAILSIGAVGFDDNGLADEAFYTVINRESCAEAFLFEQQDTVDWWNRQSAEARVVLQHAEDKTKCVPLKLGLELFNRYLTGFGADVRVWGNGGDFDNAILQSAFEAAKIKPYWKFWNNRCYRTVKNMAPGIKAVRIGTYHNAVDDARTQAEHMLQVLRELGFGLEVPA